MYIATSSQLKRYDQALLDYGYSIEQLVDKASDCLLKHFDKYQCIMIVCGPGNNGADGISLGIKLHQEGKEVLLCLTGKEEKLSQANRYYLDQAQSLSIECLFVSEETLEEFQKSVPHFDVVVDALFGFGLNSDLRGIVKYVVDLINNIEVDVIAIDIPTGLNPDTGKPYNSCICAYQTITLTAYKLAFLNPESEMYTGKVILELLDAKSFHEEMLFSQPIDFKWAKYHIKERLYDGHKGTYGRIMHVTGCYHYRGAALLAAKAAVYAGSGLVTVWSNEKVIDSSSQIYGTIINTQTMEHARAYALSGCKKIMTIENKANYEDMSYRKDTLYIFCHGFFSPKEVRFLKTICDLVSEPLKEAILKSGLTIEQERLL